MLDLVLLDDWTPVANIDEGDDDETCDNNQFDWSSG